MGLSGAIAGGIAGLGEGILGRVKREREDALLTRKEKREDLVAAREDAIADARQLRQQQFQERIHQLDSDRESTYHQDLMRQQRDLAGQSEKTQRDLAGQQNTLQRDRWDREDRRQVEESAGVQIAALDKRIQTVQDAMLKGEYLGKEDEARAELEDAKDQQRKIRYRSIRQLSEQGDPRYKGMSARDIALAAGFSREQIVDIMRQQQPTGGSSETAPAPVSPPAAQGSGFGPSSPAIDALWGGTPPAPTGPTGSLPQSPAPIADLTKKGRGNKAPGDLFDTPPANGRGSGLPTVTGRSGVQITDVGSLFESRGTPAPKKYAPGRGVPAAAKPKELTDDSMPDPKNVLTVLRAGGDLEAIPKIDQVRSLSASTLRKAGFTDQEILKLLRPSRK